MELLVVDVVEVGVFMCTCAGQHGERWELIVRKSAGARCELLRKSKSRDLIRKRE